MSVAFTVTTQRGSIQARNTIQCTGTAPNVTEQDILGAARGGRVLVHFHGGLIDQAEGLRIASRLSGCGCGVHYPAGRADVQLYVVWQSGLLDALTGILEGSVLGKVVKTVMNFFGAARGAVGWRATALPDDDASLERYYRRELQEALSEQDLEANDLLLEEDARAGQKSFTAAATLVTVAVNATRAILARRDRNPPDYSFEAMVREEVLNASRLGLIGARAWQQMKEDAAAHATGNFMDFFNQLHAVSEEVTLVGHSTGAILIAELIRALPAGFTGRRKLKVAFLAPALTVNGLNACQQALRRHVALPFPVYLMKNEVEMDDRSISWGGVNFYPGSLLQLVNFVFESPLPGQVMGWAYYADQHRQEWSGLLTLHTDHNCTTHGGFDDAQDILDRI